MVVSAVIQKCYKWNTPSSELMTSQCKMIRLTAAIAVTILAINLPQTREMATAQRQALTIGSVGEPDMPGELLVKLLIRPGLYIFFPRC
jgi:hypothetical protein